MATQHAPAHHTPAWAIALVAFSTLLLAAGQLLMKIAVTEKQLPELLYSPALIVSLILYVSAAIIMVVTLKHGQLSVLYPVIALGFVWVTLTSVLFLHESLTWHQGGGIALIIIGISIIGHRGSRRRK